MERSKAYKYTFAYLILLLFCLFIFPFYSSADPQSSNKPINPGAPEEDTIHLRWNSMGEGFTYQFQMAKDKDFRQIVIDTKCDKPEVTIPRPDEIGIYYVRTRFIAKDGNEGNFSPVQSFEIKDLSRPVIISPKEISEFRGIYDIPFKWLRVPYAESYHFLLANDRSFRFMVHEERNITGDSLLIQNLGYGTYYVKVSAIGKNGREGPFSDTVSFIISPPPPEINSLK